MKLIKKDFNGVFQIVNENRIIVKPNNELDLKFSMLTVLEYFFKSDSCNGK